MYFEAINCLVHVNYKFVREMQHSDQKYQCANDFNKNSICVLAQIQVDIVQRRGGDNCCAGLLDRYFRTGLRFTSHQHMIERASCTDTRRSDQEFWFREIGHGHYRRESQTKLEYVHRGRMVRLFNLNELFHNIHDRNCKSVHKTYCFRNILCTYAMSQYIMHSGRGHYAYSLV